MRGRSRLPKGARTTGRLLRVLGVSGTGTFAVICLVVSLLMIGSDYTSTASEQNACTLPDLVGGSGLEIFGDSALTGLSKALPDRLVGGRVRTSVHRGRTVEQAINELADLPDSAPSTFVVSLELDDPGEVASYANEIDELSLLLFDRRVLWVAMPGKTALTKVVEAANTGDTSGWQIIDVAQAVESHHGWWNGHALTVQGRKALAATIGSMLAGNTATTTATMSRAPAITVSSSTTGESFAVTGDRKSNAEAILQAGVGLSVPQRGLVIGVAVAIQESRLVNLTSGDQDSVGLFQQRPSQGWGTRKQLLDPQYAATEFFTQLLQVPGWQQMSLTDAAQTVQRSGLPNAYAQWESSATTIVAALQGKHAAGCGPQYPTATNPNAQIAVQVALSQLGVPYAWGGGDINGPTRGVCTPGAGWNDCHIVGFDCSGLMLYAWGQAGVAVPHYTVDMWADPAFTHINRDQLQPGDMVMFQTNGVPEHTGMYLGNNEMVHAPQSGDVVRTVSLSQPWYQQHYLGALRPRGLKPMTTPRKIPFLAAILSALAAAEGYATNHHQPAAPASIRSAAATLPAPPASSSTTSQPGATPIAEPPALQPIPPAGSAIYDPVAVARAWAAAANSTSYRDPRPGTWTTRAAPFVAGTEATNEQTAADGGGGQLWQRIQTSRCATTLSGLAATVPPDAPHTATSRVVYLAGTTVLSCADRTIQWSVFTAQLAVERAAGGWRVVQVQH